MKKIYITLLCAFALISCDFAKNENQMVTEEEVMNVFNDMFYALDNDLESYANYVTDDFLIYEIGRTFDLEEFLEFVKGFGKFESNRTFKNLRIDLDENSAHVSLEHTGEFTLESPTPEGDTYLYYEWLESAYLVRENGALKFKFYFSQQVN
jgi:hypothetical protein